MRTRGKPIAATREKALLSAVFNFARGEGLTNAANPCAGIRGTKAHRERYVTHEELTAVLDRADPTLAGFLELCYMTGQRPSDVLKMRRQDVQDGYLRVAQHKTGTKVRIAVVGTLAAVLARLAEGPLASVWLVHDQRGTAIYVERNAASVLEAVARMADSRPPSQGGKRRGYLKTCAGIVGTFGGDDNGWLHPATGR